VLPGPCAPCGTAPACCGGQLGGLLDPATALAAALTLQLVPCPGRALGQTTRGARLPYACSRAGPATDGKLPASARWGSRRPLLADARASRICSSAALAERAWAVGGPTLHVDESSGKAAARSKGGRPGASALVMEQASSAAGHDAGWRRRKRAAQIKFSLLEPESPECLPSMHRHAVRAVFPEWQ